MAGISLFERAALCVYRMDKARKEHKESQKSRKTMQEPCDSASP
jgi:hypothetical protein